MSVTGMTTTSNFQSMAHHPFVRRPSGALARSRSRSAGLDILVLTTPSSRLRGPVLAIHAAGRCPAGQCVTVAGDPGVGAPRQPREPRSYEQRADRTPYKVTGTKGRGDRDVTAGHLTVVADPLHGRGALF